MMERDEDRAMGQVIKIDEARIHDHLGKMVCGTVEEALNAILNTVTDELCEAERYQSSAD